MAVDLPEPGAPTNRKCCDSSYARNQDAAKFDAVASQVPAQSPARNDVGPAHVLVPDRPLPGGKMIRRQAPTIRAVMTAPQGA